MFDALHYAMLRATLPLRRHAVLPLHAARHGMLVFIIFAEPRHADAMPVCDMPLCT